jgi:hypothetical protein
VLQDGLAGSLGADHADDQESDPESDEREPEQFHREWIAQEVPQQGIDCHQEEGRKKRRHLQQSVNGAMKRGIF